MQILSDYNYILSKLKCRLHEIAVLLLINDKVSTGPCHQQNFGHDSRGYTTMSKSNFTLLNIICVHTNHLHVKAASYTFRMLTASNVH